MPLSLGLSICLLLSLLCFLCLCIHPPILFCLSQKICLFIHLPFLVYILLVSLSSFLLTHLSLAHTDRRRVHSTNWLRWNAIMHQKPIVMKNHRTFIISIKTDWQCQSYSTMGQQNINQLPPLINPVCQLTEKWKLYCLCYWIFFFFWADGVVVA